MMTLSRDTQLVVIGPSGRIDLTHVIGFDSRQVTHSLRVNRLDGNQIGLEVPKGWEGGFELERGDSVVEDFIAGMEQDDAINGSSSMYQYVSEVDGSTSTYQYDSVVFRLSNAGQVDFFASRRRRI